MFRWETVFAAMPAGLREATIKTAISLAPGKLTTAGMVPSSIAQLVEGEIRTMMLMKLTSIAAGVVATGFVTMAVGLLATRGRPTPLGQGAGAPAQPRVDDEETRTKSRMNLMNLGLAMNSFDDDRKRFPAAAILKDGKPLLSWRVALLPFLDERALYDKFHLDEPWDSPNNKALLDQMPDIYAPVTRKEESKNSTYYQVFDGPGALFRENEGWRREDIKDGANLTIMLVEGAKPVPWTKPEDLPFDKEKPLPELGGLFKGGFYVLFASGRVRFLSRQTKPEVMRALITPNGGEAISDNDL
jgi:hypothetical protein